MLLESPNSTREYIDNYLISQNLSITPDIEASNMDFLVEGAKLDLGITSVIREFSLTDLQNRLLVELPLRTPIPSRYITVIYKNSTDLSIAAKTLINFLKV